MKRLAGQQTGSSLIEVLVALVILATGIMGMAGLLLNSLKVNQSSYARTQATFNSQDIIERMRSNRAAISGGNYDNPAPSLTPACLTQAGCSPAQMAAHDVAEWQSSVATNLPGGQAIVCLDSDPADGTALAPACDSSGTVYAIKIWWDDDRDGTPEYQYVVSFDP